MFRLLWVLLCLPILGIAQDEVVYEDKTYLPNIGSAKLHLWGSQLAYPIAVLNSADRLLLSFDDLDADEKGYTYTVLHCNADWQPSGLSDVEYLESFTTDYVTDYEFSFNTETPYTHYEVVFPNDNIQFTKSGNYLLVVYDEEDDKRLALTRRFMVAEPNVAIWAQMTNVKQAGKGRTHQEIDFRVNYENADLKSPRATIKATVLQNGQWTNAITGIEPLFERQKQLLFSHHGKVLFAGKNEFRALDLREFLSESRNVNIGNASARIGSIELTNEGYDVLLYADEKRYSNPHLNYADNNGHYVIDNRRRSADPHLEGDYAQVLFSLKSPTIADDGAYYLYGGLSDWAIQEQFRMVYNEAVNAYVVKVPLKQGYYDYAYAFVPDDEEADLEFDYTEGNWAQTLNDYTILVYYRPFGSRYDRLIGVRTLDMAD